MCTLFIAALLTTPKKHKQLKYPSSDEWKYMVIQWKIVKKKKKGMNTDKRYNMDESWKH